LTNIHENVLDLILNIELAVANEIDKGTVLTPARMASTMVCFMMQEVGSVLEETLADDSNFRYDLARTYKQQAEILQNTKGD